MNEKTSKTEKKETRRRAVHQMRARAWAWAWACGLSVFALCVPLVVVACDDDATSSDDDDATSSDDDDATSSDDDDVTSSSDDDDTTSSSDDDDTTSSDDDATSSDDDDAYPFVEADYVQDDPNVLTERLCDEASDPDGAPDKIQIKCRTEAGNFAPEPPATPPAELLVMTYNLERGQRLDGILDGFAKGTLPTPDVLLANELDRGCTRSNDRNVARDVAKALGMNYVFAVEFIELPRKGGAGGRIDNLCEHGNAIFSRFPLGNVETLRHALQKDWYVPPEERGDEGEPRLGGRIDVMADINVGGTIIHASSIHYESNPAYGKEQNAAAKATAAWGLAKPYRVLVGGDTNAPFYTLDLSIGATGKDRRDPIVYEFLDKGYIDSHAELNDDQVTRHTKRHHHRPHFRA